MRVFICWVFTVTLFLASHVNSFKNGLPHRYSSFGKIQLCRHRASKIYRMSSATDLVADHMTTNVVVVDPEMKIEDCARLLIDKNIAGAPVVEDGRIVGVISQFDYLFKEAGGLGINVGSASPTLSVQKILAKTVRKAMTRNPFVMHKDSSVQEAAKLMVEKKIQRIPVVEEDGQTLVGIISVSDVMRHLLDKAKSD